MNLAGVSKGDGTPFKVFTPFWRNAEKFFMDEFLKNKALSQNVIKSFFL